MSIQDADPNNPTPTPDPSTGTPKPDDKGGRTWTDDEVQRKLQGQGKELEKLNAQLAKYREDESKRKQAEDEAKRKRLEEQGEHKKLAEQERARADSLAEKLAAIQERETQRLERVTADNDVRAKKLPKHLQNLIPSGLDADETAMQIARLEKLVQTKEVGVSGGGGRGSAKEPEDAVEASGKAGHDFVFGKNDGGK